MDTVKRLKKQTEKAPQSSGVYFFKNKNGRIIYIGKAQNLATRLKSYFSLKGEAQLSKQKMIEEAGSVSWQETVSDIEALILESPLIKKHKPAYNIALKDDKNYFFVGFTKEEFPKISITHQPKNFPPKADSPRAKKLKIKNCDYVGPFTDGSSLKTALRILRRIYPYCTCKALHERPCVRTEINKCLGICCLAAKERSRFFPDFKERGAKYKKNIRGVKAILEGKKQTLSKNISREMRQASEKKEFEKAEELHNESLALEKIFKHRDFIGRDEESYAAKAINYLKKILKIPEIQRIEAYDISNIQGADAVGAMTVFDNGVLDKSAYRKFRVKSISSPNDVLMLKEILSRRLAHKEWPLADLMIVDGGKNQLKVLEQTIKSAALPKATGIAAIAKKEEILLTKTGIFHLKKMPPPLLHFIQLLRNEAHRFAIQYHRKLRSKSTFIP